jgi:TolA-binding protein
MNNRFVQITSILFAVAAASLSALLTFQFMEGLGKEINQPKTMASMGLILDACKTLCPIFVLFLWRQKMFLSALFGGALGLTLSTVSFVASMSAIDNGVQAAKANSQQYIALSSQIESYEREIDDLRTLASKQQDANLISRSSSTLDKIAPLNAKVANLTVQLANFSPDESVVDRYGKEISLIASLCLELVSVFLTLVMHAVKKQVSAQLNTLKHTHKNECSTPCADVVSQSILDTASTHSGTVELENESGIFAAKTRCDEQLKIDIKELIVSRKATPSIRGVQAKITAQRDVISDVLSDLHQVGILKPYRNGYTYS